MTAKIPIEIIQELIAIHTTRLELVEKLAVKKINEDTKIYLHSSAEQSNRSIKELMVELSNFGDAALSSVDHQNEYQVMYKNVLDKIDAMNAEESERLFQSLEIALKNIYQTILQTQKDLPSSLRKILVDHTN